MVSLQECRYTRTWSANQSMVSRMANKSIIRLVERLSPTRSATHQENVEGEFSRSVACCHASALLSHAGSSFEIQASIQHLGRPVFTNIGPITRGKSTSSTNCRIAASKINGCPTPAMSTTLPSSQRKSPLWTYQKSAFLIA